MHTVEERNGNFSGNTFGITPSQRRLETIVLITTALSGTTNARTSFTPRTGDERESPTRRPNNRHKQWFSDIICFTIKFAGLLKRRGLRELTEESFSTVNLVFILE